MTAYTVTIRRYNQAPYDAIVAEARADSPIQAIGNVASRHLHLHRIGSVEHFPGGGTYHVQFNMNDPRRHSTNGAISLSDKYIAQVEQH